MFMRFTKAASNLLHGKKDAKHSNRKWKRYWFELDPIEKKLEVPSASFLRAR